MGEKKQGSSSIENFVRAIWYFRPKDVPAGVLKTLPKGKPVAKEIFFSDMAEENDVRSVISGCSILLDPNVHNEPRKPADLARINYVCRFQYLTQEKALRPVKAKPPKEPHSSGRKEAPAKLKPEAAAGADAGAATGEDIARDHEVGSPARSEPPSSRSEPPSSRSEPPSSRSEPPSSPIAPSSPLLAPLDGLDGKELLSPRMAAPAKVEHSRVGLEYQADVPAVGMSAEDDVADSLMRRTWLPVGAHYDTVRGGMTGLSDAAVADFLVRARGVHGLVSGDIVRILDEPLDSLRPEEGSVTASAEREVAQLLKSKVLAPPGAAQWGVFVEDVDASHHPKAAAAAAVNPSPSESEVASPNGARVDSAAEKCVTEGVTEGAEASASAASRAEAAPTAQALGSANGAFPAERRVRVVFLHRTTSSKARSVVPLSRVCGRFSEPGALECLLEARLDSDAALALWAKRLEAEAPPLRAWSSDEVKTLNTAMGRFNDDFRSICSFLPGKSVHDVAELYYMFFAMFQRQGDSVLHLFKMSEARRPLAAAGLDRETFSAKGTKREGEAKRRKGEQGEALSVRGGIQAGAKGNGKRKAGALWGEGNGSSGELDEEGDKDEDEEGSEVGRVAAAQRFLNKSKALMPGNKYARMIELLVLFDTESISMPALLAELMNILRNFPCLQKGFHPFLPPSFNMRGPNAV